MYLSFIITLCKMVAKYLSARALSNNPRTTCVRPSERSSQKESHSHLWISPQFWRARQPCQVFHYLQLWRLCQDSNPGPRRRTSLWPLLADRGRGQSRLPPTSTVLKLGARGHLMLTGGRPVWLRLVSLIVLGHLNCHIDEISKFNSCSAKKYLPLVSWTPTRLALVWCLALDPGLPNWYKNSNRYSCPTEPFSTVCMTSTETSFISLAHVNDIHRVQGKEIASAVDWDSRILLPVVEVPYALHMQWFV